MFDRLATFGIGRPGQDIVDVGTGTGTVARSFAVLGCRVIGVDPSPELLDQARRLDVEAGASVDYRVGTAEATGLPDASVDVLSAGQCWHWFDRQAAEREARRVLRPGGAVVICHFDWVPLPGNLVEATESLIVEYNPSWTVACGPDMYSQWTIDAAAGFLDIETFSYVEGVPYSHEAWRGRIRASSGVAASLSAELVEQFDVRHGALLAERFPSEPLVVPHRVWVLIARDLSARSSSPAWTRWEPRA
ncbi:MAG: methyltransferase [Acidimicrobiaceae bacterium]|nr:methyltransferase [Acidimicrobiaceae bacterium]